MKQTLQELCSNLEKILNDRRETNQKRTVKLFSELKPSDYYLPKTFITTSRLNHTEGKKAWFVEISIDNKVVFRESYLPKDNEDLKIVEGFLITRILQNIFNFGVMSSKKFMDEQTECNDNMK